MSEGCSGGSDSIATHRNAASRAAELLALAASPTFAIMALLTGIVHSGRVEMVGMAAHVTPISGMVTMYLLMSAFHAGAWLNLVLSRLRPAASSQRFTKNSHPLRASLGAPFRPRGSLRGGLRRE